MWSIFTRFARVAALGLLVLGGMGCPESDVVESGLGQIVFEIEVNPAGADRYETGLLSINGLNFRPADPATAAAIGNQVVGLLSFPVTVNLNAAGVTTAATWPLSPGTYELANIKLQQFQLIDTTVPLPPGPDCVDNIDVLSDNFQSTIQALEPGGTLVDGFNPAPTLVVPLDGNGTMRLVIDGAAFVAAVEARYDCRTTGACTSNDPSGRLVAPCLNSFRPNNESTAKQLFLDELTQQVFGFQ